MQILVTGGCGFVGSSLAIDLKKKYPYYKIVCLDNLKRRGSELNLPRLKNFDIEFVHGDIRCKSDLDPVGMVDCIIDAAAEPSVSAGINNSPSYVVDTNLCGTLNALEYANKYDANFIFLSTSRVYPIESLNKINYDSDGEKFFFLKEQTLDGISEKGISENFPIEGARSFYGSAKLSSEYFIKEYAQFSVLKTIINRCGIITGPFQMGKVDQGVIVLWVARHYWKQSLSYIGYGGEGLQVRDILAVSDLAELLDWQIHNIEQVKGTLFNVGGGRETSVSLKQLTHFCKEITGNSIMIEKIKETNPYDIPIYITDNTKVHNQTGWRPKKSVEIILSEIFEWIMKEGKALATILKG